MLPKFSGGHLPLFAVHRRNISDIAWEYGWRVSCVCVSVCVYLHVIVVVEGEILNVY